MEMHMWKNCKDAWDGGQGWGNGNFQNITPEQA